MIKILIDTLGGDNSPAANVEGALRAVKEFDDLTVVFVGKTEENKALIPAGTDMSRIEFIDAPDEISCNDKPTEAIRSRTESSLYKCFESLRSDADALVTAGSTGATLAGAVLKLGRVRGIKRPAFCPILPTMNGGIVAICDSGANAECDPVYLHQFALMGDLYLKKAYGIENPKVALLNIGTEEEKGDTLRKETYALLKNESAINFVGNMESRDLLSGNYDLVVCDGFAGNVLIKSTEGACLELLKVLKKTFTKNLKTKMGALILKKDIYALKDMMDYNNYGGAVLLGAKKTIVKSHGSSKATAIYMSVKKAYEMERNGLISAISEAAATFTETANN